MTTDAVRLTDEQRQSFDDALNRYLLQYDDAHGDTGLPALIATVESLLAQERERCATICDERGCDCGDVIVLRLEGRSRG